MDEIAGQVGVKFPLWSQKRSVSAAFHSNFALHQCPDGQVRFHIPYNALLAPVTRSRGHDSNMGGTNQDIKSQFSKSLPVYCSLLHI